MFCFTGNKNADGHTRPAAPEETVHISIHHRECGERRGEKTQASEYKKLYNLYDLRHSPNDVPQSVTTRKIRYHLRRRRIRYAIFPEIPFCQHIEYRLHHNHLLVNVL
jgi:hypothetical protein